jgi:hypothetical protein
MSTATRADAETGSGLDAAPPDLSASIIIARTFALLRSHFAGLALAAGLPMLMSGLLLYFTGKLYLGLLATFLRWHSARIAGLALAVLAIGFFAWLFLCAICGGGVLRQVRGASSPRSPLLRLYAAMLRLMLVLILLVISAVAITLQFHLNSILSLLLVSAGMVFAASILLLVRCSLLLPVIAFYEKDQVLRRAWRLTSGHVWVMARIWAGLVFLPALLIQFSGERILRFLGYLGPAILPPGLTPTPSQIIALSDLMPCLAVTVTMTVGICLTLACIGSSVAYDALLRRS